MKELKEKEEMEIEGGVHQPLSKGIDRIVKRNSTLHGKEVKQGNAYISEVQYIAKGELVTVVTFSDSTGVTLNGEPATLVKYKGKKWYIKAKDIANSFPKKGYAELRK